MFPKPDTSAIDSKFSYDAWSRRHFREAVRRADGNLAAGLWVLHTWPSKHPTVCSVSRRLLADA